MPDITNHRIIDAIDIAPLVDEVMPDYPSMLFKLEVSQFLLESQWRQMVNHPDWPATASKLQETIRQAFAGQTQNEGE